MIQTSVRAERRRTLRAQARERVPGRYKLEHPLGNRKERRSAIHVLKAQSRKEAAQKQMIQKELLKIRQAEARKLRQDKKTK